MSGVDLQDLIILLNNYYMQLRDRLCLSKKVTFGLELEFENANKDLISFQLSESLYVTELKLILLYCKILKQIGTI